MSYFYKDSASANMGEYFERLRTLKHHHIISYPEDCGPGFEHFKSFHCCYFCGDQAHEANLTRDDHGNWIHPDCLDYYNEIQDKLSKKQTYIKRLR